MYNSTNHILSMTFKGFLVATISFLNGLCEQNSVHGTKKSLSKKGHPCMYKSFPQMEKCEKRNEGSTKYSSTYSALQ